MSNQEHLAIASVPVQSWGELYEQGQALSIGTIFRELDKPFFVSEQDFGNIPRSCPSQRPGECKDHDRAQQSKESPSAAEQPEKRADGSSVTETVEKQIESQEQQKREDRMLQVMEVSFMLDDIRLYMDTHPQDEQGLKFLKQTVQKRKELLKEFAKQYYPLTVDCMADLYENNPDSDCYCWEKGPMPWEGACI